MLNVGKPIIPKEHGAWAVLLVPMAIAAAMEERISPSFIVLVLASLAVFLAYLPVQLMLRTAARASTDEKIRTARSWAIVYLLSASLFGGILLLQGFWLLAPISILGAALFVLNFFLTRDNPKSVASDLSAVIGLTLTGPAASYVLTGSITGEVLSVWVLTMLFFGSSVFYVHMKIRASGLKKETIAWSDRFSVGQLNLIYHAVTLGIVFILMVNRATPSLAFVAFVPIVVHAVIGTIRLSSRVRFNRVGFFLLEHSVVFVVLLSWMYS